MKQRNVIEIARLRPTQMTVGMLQVRDKRAKLKALKRRPSELVDFILTHPVRVVAGPAGKFYVIDHHHLALALLKEGFETAPMEIEGNFSTLSQGAFWKRMESLHFVHAVDGEGKIMGARDIPAHMKNLQDDPYRSLAGFVREAGGFRKVQTPYAEFQWADYYRDRIKEKLIHKDFDEALKRALLLARDEAAKALPGFIASAQA